MVLMLVASLTINAQEKSKSYDWSKVMDAIIQVESEGNAKAHNPIGDCCGVLQITKILVKECNQILQREKSSKRYTNEDRYNVGKSKEMFVLLQEHFNPEHNVEKAIKCWNCGFYTKNWRTKSKEYYIRVMKHYSGGS